MDATTAKLITAMATGQSAANAALIALLIQKGLITIDEATAVLEGYERELAATDMPQSASPIRTVLQLLSQHFAKSLKANRPAPH